MLEDDERLLKGYKTIVSIYFRERQDLLARSVLRYYLFQFAPSF
jgi:hypothetical protein